MPPPPPRPTSPAGGDDRRPLLAAKADKDALLLEQEDSGSTTAGKEARQHFANVLKGFIGSNFLAVPFAFAASGLLLGPLAVSLVAAVSGADVYVCKPSEPSRPQAQHEDGPIDRPSPEHTGYGCVLLVNIRRRLMPRSNPLFPPPEAARALETYPQVAGAVLGPWGYYLVEAALVLTQFGCVLHHTWLLRSAQPAEIDSPPTNEPKPKPLQTTHRSPATA